MAGYVRTNEKCPVCGGKFALGVIGRDRALICPEHRTAPRRYYVDSSGFGLKTRKLYKDRDGKRLDSYRHAERFLEQMRAAKDSRAGFDPADWEPARLREYRFGAEWGKWTAAESPGWSHGHRRQVRQVLTLITPVWGEIDVRDIRNAHMIDLRTALLADEYAASYVRLVLAIAHSFLAAMKKRGDIKEVPERPEVDDTERDLWILDGKQQAAIIARTPPRYRPILRLLAATGIRPCEACALRVRDVVGGHIFIQRSIDDWGNVHNRTKGERKRRRRRIFRKPVPAGLEAEIAAAMRDKLPDAFLFTNRIGRPFRPGTLSRIWKRGADAERLPVSLYVGIRHSFATMVYREEEEAAKQRTAKAMGHVSPAITFRHYVADCPNSVQTGNAAPQVVGNEKGN